MQNLLDRLKMEYAELVIRIGKQDAFLSSPELEKLPPGHVALLMMQLQTMVVLRAILEARLDALTGEEGKEAENEKNA